MEFGTATQLRHDEPSRLLEHAEELRDRLTRKAEAMPRREQEQISKRVWPSLAATVLLLIFGRPMLSLFGPQFTDGYHLMFILAAGLLARAAIGPIERLLNMLGQQRVCAAVYAGAFALNLVLCFALIPLLGMAGAAIATASALIFESILLFLVTKNRLGFHVFIWGRRAET